MTVQETMQTLHLDLDLLTNRKWTPSEVIHFWTWWSSDYLKSDFSQEYHTGDFNLLRNALKLYEENERMK